MFSSFLFLFFYLRNLCICIRFIIRQSQEEHDSLLAEVPKTRKTHRITAPVINDISYTWRSLKRRERRLKLPENKPVRDGHESLSKAGLGAADTLDAVDKAGTVQRGVRDTLQAFERSRARIKDQRTQRIRSKRAWAIKAAEERRFLRDHSGREMRGEGKK